MKILTIIICTHNRSKLLMECVNSLIKQNTENVEIIIIDNNSKDNTKDISLKYISKYKNIRYVFEQNIGLSFARNRGIKEAKYNWILYIDDDAIAFPDLIERALHLAKRGDFDCVGGMYYGYYENEKPKWIPNEFGSKQLFSTTLVPCSYTIPSGGIVLYKKSMLESLKGFSPIFGMVGDKKWLGEETELQFRAENKGYKLGFDPELKIHHLVKPEYTKLSWHLKRSFLEGNAISKIVNTSTIGSLILSFLRSCLGLFLRRIPVNTYKSIFNKNYYWQNLVLDSFRPNLLNLGKMAGYFKMPKN